MKDGKIREEKLETAKSLCYTLLWILFFLNTIIIVMNEARKMKWSIF